MASVSELRGRCRFSAAVAIIYNYLGPFSITTTVMRTQECLHLCQNTLGKPFTAPNFLMHCVPCLLILAMSVRCKKSSCDFVKVWKEETPVWAFLNFSTLVSMWDTWCNMKNWFWECERLNFDFFSSLHIQKPGVPLDHPLWTRILPNNWTTRWCLLQDSCTISLRKTKNVLRWWNKDALFRLWRKRWRNCKYCV